MSKYMRALKRAICLPLALLTLLSVSPASAWERRTPVWTSEDGLGELLVNLYNMSYWFSYELSPWSELPPVRLVYAAYYDESSETYTGGWQLSVDERVDMISDRYVDNFGRAHGLTRDPDNPALWHIDDLPDVKAVHTFEDNDSVIRDELELTYPDGTVKVFDNLAGGYLVYFFSSDVSCHINRDDLNRALSVYFPHKSKSLMFSYEDGSRVPELIQYGTSPFRPTSQHAFADTDRQLVCAISSLSAAGREVFFDYREDGLLCGVGDIRPFLSLEFGDQGLLSGYRLRYPRSSTGYPLQSDD